MILIAKRIRPLIRWGPFFLALAILFFIFRSLDMMLLKQTLQRVNLWLLGTGLLFFILIIFLGVLRWKLILVSMVPHKTEYLFLLKAYWIGLALGKFFPGSVTWDIYRITRAGNRYGGYTENTLCIILEKLAALASAAVLLPFLYWNIRGMNKLNHIWDIFPDDLLFSCVWILLILMIAVAVVLAGGWYAKKKVVRWIPHGLSFKTVNAKTFFSAALISSMIYVLWAASNFFFLRALDYPLPFSVHFFLSPIFSILCILPISIGGIGVREGSFILFYGMFGISMETALLLSFMNLGANVVNTGIGVGIMLANSLRRGG